MGCKRLTKWWYLQGDEVPGLHLAGCKRLTKWWYLQDIPAQLFQELAVKGLQNGGIYKMNMNNIKELLL